MLINLNFFLRLLLIYSYEQKLFITFGYNNTYRYYETSFMKVNNYYKQALQLYMTHNSNLQKVIVYIFI